MTQASREWNSQAYHRLSRPQFEWGLKVLDRLPLRGDETVADAGCGSGKVTAKLLERLPHGRVVAMDLSVNMLQTARDHLRRNSPIRCSSSPSTCMTFLSTALLDGVFSTAAFHWLPDHDRLFRSLLRSLKPGGWLEAQCGGGPNLARVRERTVALMSRPDFAPFFAGWSPTWQYPDDITTAERMRRAGFAEIKTWLEEMPTTLSGCARVQRVPGHGDAASPHRPHSRSRVARALHG